jgi:hypothetical protein
LTYPLCYQALFAESSGIQRSGTKLLTAEIAELPLRTPRNPDCFLCDLWNFSALSAVKSFRFFSLKTALKTAVYRSGSGLEIWPELC